MKPVTKMVAALPLAGARRGGRRKSRPWVSLDEKGGLRYETTAKGDRIADISHGFRRRFRRR